ncbi:MAG TPA: helix-turn-helix domain-containing protein [Flavisolibacter sp.]|nr:helix-turn-helix domain-containing protein [Flavisolibacter sp.]
MQVQFYTPHVLLQEFIHCIMVVEYKVSDTINPVVYNYPPTPQTSLFFYIDELIQVRKEGETDFAVQPPSVFVGQQLSRVAIHINKNHKAVRVGFHPGGLHRLLGLSMAEMIDGHYDAADIFYSEMNEVNEKLHEARDYDGIKDVVEQFLLKKARTLKKTLPFDRAMLQLLKLHGNVPIEQIAAMACLSLRQFERVSKERIGLPPKLYARLVRFSKAYRLREDCPHLNWTQIAYECGYFDQMHFIRDFKEFAGETPRMIEKELDNVSLRMQIGLRL